MNRLTLESAKETMEKFGIDRLIHMLFGFDEGSPNTGCAVGLLVVRAKQTTRNIRADFKRNSLADFDGIARESGTTPKYVHGLNDGFENCKNTHIDNPDYLTGLQDGEALRVLA
jgi:hypothetical protein